MLQPDTRLFRPIMALRAAIIGIMLAAYTITWQLAPEDRQFAVISGILAAETALSAALYVFLAPRFRAWLVHISLLIDAVATTGLVMCTGPGSLFQLFYVLIVLAAGLLYGHTTGIYYLTLVSLSNISALAYDYWFPIGLHKPLTATMPHWIMAVALSLVAFYLLLSVRTTQHGTYLQLLYDHVSDGLLIVDDAGRIVDANGRITSMLGREKNELIGETLESLVAVTDTDVEMVRDQFRRCLTGEAVSFELAFARANSEPLPVEVSAQYVSGLSPARVQAFFRDISARRMMEAEIRRQNAELRRSNQEKQAALDVALNASRMKSQFLANMSHELRTPLNSIIGYQQFVLEDRERPLADDQQEDLRRSLRASRQLLDLITGVLDLARIESGRESVALSRFGANDLVDSVVDSVAPMAKSKGLRVECRVDDGLPEMQTDDKKLRQILLNLLANAVKFTEHGEVRIECSRDGADFVRFLVRDTGIGIPPAHLDEIFNEFHQVDSSIHKQYGGTGLGLAIVKRLVELLKGTIEVTSEVGAGSKFTVVVPLTLTLAKDAAGGTTVVPVRTEPPPPRDASESEAA